jgi:ribosomal protein S25
MNAQQRAVVAQAKKDNLNPMEIAAELMNHDITEVVLGLMRKREVAFNKLSEKDQDAVIAEIGFELKKITATAARVINGQGVECVQAKMKSLKIDGKLTATLVIEGDEPNRHVLTDKTHDKSDILIVLYPNNYSEGMSAHQGEKDQKPLDLDSGAPEKPEKKPRASSSAKAAGGIAKAIELPQKLIDDVRAFILDQQNCKTSAIQNFAKCNVGKAEALRKHFEAEGLIEFVGTDASGDYELVRKAPEKADDPVSAEQVDLDQANTDEPITELTDDLYDRIVAKTTEKGQATAGALAVTFDISFEIAEQAFDRMELEGVIDAEGNLAESETFPVMD